MFREPLHAIARRWNGLAREGPGGSTPAHGARSDPVAQLGTGAWTTVLPAGGYQVLHGRRGTRCFPLQIFALASEPGTDFEGGDFVMVEQRPRMQSRPAVIPMRRGDVVIAPTMFRPVQGSHGVYRVTPRYAVAKVRTGVRIGAEILFETDAADVAPA
jgi:hypothetical protein